MRTDNITESVNQDALHRLDWADCLRSVATFGVVLIHSCGHFFYDYARLNETEWLQVTFLDSLVRFSVPMFIMLSGSLLLGKKQGALSEIPKRISKVALPLIIWSLVYLHHVAGNIYDISITSIITKPAMYHLWFVYMLIGIYLVLPILNALYAAIESSKTLGYYFFLLWFVLTCIPIYYKPQFFSLLQLPHFFGFGGYFLLGAFLACKSHLVSRRVWTILFVAGVLSTFFLTWYFSIQQKAPMETAFEYFSANVVIASAAAFALLRRVRTSQKCARSLQYVSDRSFVIYFAHVLVLEHVRTNKFVVEIGGLLPTGITILAITAFTFFLSLLVASMLKFIPGNKKIFG